MAKGNRTGKGYFQPGNSANPGGRPAIVRQVRELLQEQVPANIERLVAIRDDPNSKASDVLVAIRELNDRAMGRSPQAVELSGNVGNENGPADHKPDLASLRERTLAQMETQKAGALTTTAINGQDADESDGATIQ